MRRFLVLINFLLIYFTIDAQELKFYSADDNLSSSLINRVYDDSNNNIWVCTEKGLNKFDGVKFTRFLEDRNVLDIIEYQRGKYLVSSVKGICILDAKTNRLSSSLYFYDGNSPFLGRFENFQKLSDGRIICAGFPLCEIQFVNQDSAVLRRIEIPYHYFGSSSVAVDKDDNIFVVNNECRILKIKDENLEKIYNLGIKDLSIVSIFCDENYLYFGAISKGIFRLNLDNSAVEQLCDHISVYDIAILDENNLLLATDGQGLKIWNKKEQKLLDYTFFGNRYFSAENSKIHSICIDEQKNFWIGVFHKGLLLKRQNSNGFNGVFASRNSDFYIGEGCVSALYQLNDSVIFIGTDNYGLTKINRIDHTFRNFLPNNKNIFYPSSVLAFAADAKKENLYIGSYSHGLVKMDLKTYKTTRIGIDINNSNESAKISSLSFSGNNILWVGTMGNGLLGYNPESKTFIKPKSQEGIVNRWISYLYNYNNEKLFIGTFDGLSIMDLKSDSLKITKHLDSHIIHCIQMIDSNTVYFGTPEGLFLFDLKAKTIENVDEKYNLPKRYIYSIEVDYQKNLWLSTDYGIIYVDLKKRSNKLYTSNNGLISNEFSKFTGITTYPDSSIVFGAVNGYTYFNPKDIKDTLLNYHIKITDLYIGNQSIRQISKYNQLDLQNLTLDSDDNNFAIEFTTFEHVQDNYIKFAYSINDNPLIEMPLRSRQINFFNQKPGSYQIKLYSINEGVLGEPYCLNIRILRPWYNSIGSWIFYNLLFIALIFYFIRQFTIREKNKQIIQQHLQIEQDKEDKLRLFTNFSHDILSPLSLIFNPLNQLIKNDDDKVRGENYSIIQRNVKRLYRLVNQIMDIRKIDSKTKKLHFSQVDPEGILNDIYQSFVKNAEERQINFNFYNQYSEVPDKEFYIDVDSLDQILMNLVSNAFKFTLKDGSIDLFLNKKDEDTIQFVVRDNGVGVQEDEIDKIFQLFYQSDNSQKSTVGWGVGLYLSKHLVDMMYGRIICQKNQLANTGLEFIIEFPLGKSHINPEYLVQKSSTQPVVPVFDEESKEKEIQENLELDKKNGNRKFKILVADDDLDILEYVSKQLGKTYKIITAQDGKEAFDKVFEQQPDLVISDVVMPHMSGYILCQKIKKNINLNHIPVILLTGKSSVEDNISGLDYGADSYIVKPFNLEILQKTVENLLNLRQLLKNNFSGKQDMSDKLEKIELSSPDEKLMERIMKVINSNLSNPNLTADFIASEVGISRMHLHRKLKELTNQTTSSFIKNLRLKAAGELLKEKHQNISEVASKCGFSSLSTFSAVFKEFYGKNPSEY